MSPDGARVALTFHSTLLRDAALLAPRVPARVLRAVQARRLRRVLASAVANVDFYGDLYASRTADVGAVRDGSGLWSLPTVTKDDLLAAGARSYVDRRYPLARLVESGTSGSLGAALPIYSTAREGGRIWAGMWSAWAALGLRPWDRVLLLEAPHLRHRPPLLRARGRYVAVNAPPGEALARLKAFHPRAIIGSTEAIALLAAEARRDGSREALRARRGVRLVFPFGQSLSTALADMIKEGFEARILDTYGSVEAGWVGFDCGNRAGLHVPIDRVVVQVARLGQPDQPAAPGETGEVIVSSLLRTTTPFIRYRLGDVATWEPAPCVCGRTTPRLRSLEGRVQDLLLSTAGTWVSPGALATDLAYRQPAITDHRIVQESRDLVRVHLVVAEGFGVGERERVQTVVQRHLGDVKVIVEEVDAVPADPSGKRRRVHRAFER